MASHWFDKALTQIISSYMVSGSTIKACLCMTNTTADTQFSPAFLSNITTLDRCDGTNYADQTISGPTATQDDTDQQGIFSGGNVTFASLGAGSRQTQGVLIYKFGTGDTDSTPLIWVDFSSPVTHNGTDFAISWNSGGIGVVQNG
jgi:hypothetical protein